MIHFGVNPTLSTMKGVAYGTDWNNKGWECMRVRDYEGAAGSFRRALQLKLSGYGPEHASTALGYNALAEALAQLGSLDEAEENSKKAVSISMRHNPPVDQAYYRETLAVINEMKGKLDVAREIRRMGRPSTIMCSNYNVRQL